MKKLEELGISPAPWSEPAYGLIISADNAKVADFPGAYYAPSDADFVMMLAAPELYECLREAVSEYCHDCIGKDVESDECHDDSRDVVCFVRKWRAALAKAAGESEDDDE